MLGFGSQRKSMSNLLSMDTHIFYNNRSLSGILQGLSHSHGKGHIKKQVQESEIRFSTWNIGTLRGKSWEVIGVMRDRKINILCLQETKSVGEKAKDIGGYKLWYTGKVSSRNDVGIIVDEEWKKNVVEINRIGDRIISLKMVVGEETINVISAYARQVGAESQIKEQFWEEFEALIQGIPILEKVFIGGDLNGHVDKEAGQYTQAHGGFGFDELNNEGQSIIEFYMAYDLKIVNTCFKKREDHLITYKSGANRSQIDFFLVKNSDRRISTNFKVIPIDGVTTQHRTLVLDVCMTFKRLRR